MRVKWSQNFLVDERIAQKSTEALALEKDDTVLEIGPGKGILTRTLLKTAKKVTAVEIDPSLFRLLKEKFGHRTNFNLIESDFLKISSEEEKMICCEGLKIIGNLPYAVVSPILQKILQWSNWALAVFMVQKEVGERILAKEGSRKYGILSASVQIRASAEMVGLVPMSSFHPVPKVESMLLRITPLKNPILHSPEEEEAFFKVVRAAFSHRRKTILNSMLYALEAPKKSLEAIFDQCKISPLARAEEISILDFYRMSRVFKKEFE